MPTEFTPRPWKQIPCSRISPEGRLEVEFRGSGEETKIWQEFNLRHRPDWALMVGTEVVHLGVYTSLEEVSNAIKGWTPPVNRRPSAGT
jgi:hypothetical protein